MTLLILLTGGTQAAAPAAQVVTAVIKSPDAGTIVKSPDLASIIKSPDTATIKLGGTLED